MTEPTSGPSLRLTLPHTKVQVGVPLMTYYMAISGYQAKAHGVLPDYPVEYTIQELLKGEDKELALAFELARKSIQSQAASFHFETIPANRSRRF